MYETPNNFVTHRPAYLGAVNEIDFKEAMDRVENEVPLVLTKVVKKDVEDTLITLDRFEIMEAVDNGDKTIKSRYEDIVKKQGIKQNEVMEDLARAANKSIIPQSYTHKVAAVEDVRGDVRQVLKGYVNEKG